MAVDAGSWIKLFSSLVTGRMRIILIWCNIIALLLYQADLQDVQNLLVGTLSWETYSKVGLVAVILLNVNNIILNLIFSGWMCWAIFEIMFNQNPIGMIIQDLLNSQLVKTFWWTLVLSYIVIGNIITSISFILVFFFQDLTLFEKMLAINGTPFSFQHPASVLTWLPFGIGALCAISSISISKKVTPT